MIVKWLMAPSRVPDAPPMWVVILVFGVGWNLITGHRWVVYLSVSLTIVAFAVRRLRLRGL